MPRPCDDSDSNNRVLWRLRLSATVPGVDYESQFEVPVFRTPASDQPLSADEERITQDPLAGAEYQQPADSRIVVTSNRRGTEILFPAARNPGAATSLTFFLLLWLGCIALQLYFRAPLVFPIVTGLFGLLIFIGVLDLWLQVSRVTVDAGTLTWASGYLFPGRERTLHCVRDCRCNRLDRNAGRHDGVLRCHGRSEERQEDQGGPLGAGQAGGRVAGGEDQEGLG